MTDYICPDEIIELCEQDSTAGRRAAIQWYHALRLEVGDRFWLPDGVSPSDIQVGVCPQCGPKQ